MPDSTVALPYPGLSAAEVVASRSAHGANLLTPPPREPWWKELLAKFGDPVIRILLIAAGLAILVGLSHTPPDWIEGLGIVVAILLSTGLAFWNERMAAREFELLNRVSDEAAVKVIRGGEIHTVPRKDLVVGDIVLIELGEETPADGQVLDAVNLQVDESRLTGESVPVAKAPAEQGSGAARPRLANHAGEHAYPADLVLRGTLIADGRGTLRIVAVGDQTDLGKTARAAAEENVEPTPLTKQLLRLSKLIGVFGLGFAVLTFTGLVALGGMKGSLTLTGPQGVFAFLLFGGVALALAKVWLPILLDGFAIAGIRPRLPAIWLKWAEEDSIATWLGVLFAGFGVVAAGLCVLWMTGHLDPDWRRWLAPGDGQKYLKYFMIAVTIIVVAVPEGLAMAVTLSLAYSMRRMAAANNLVREMHACETIGAATVICSDKTGTLTQNKMRVQELHLPAEPNYAQPGLLPTATAGLSQKLDSPNAQLLAEAFAANSSAHLEKEEGGGWKVLGNPTEGALLLWLREQDLDYASLRAAFRLRKQWGFSAERKFMATLGAAPGLAGGILHAKGAPELILARCRRLHAPEGRIVSLTDSERGRIEAKLRSCQSRGMRTLGFAYHDAPDPAWAEAKIEDAAHDLVWLGFVAIADPVRPDAPEAVAACARAGVGVKMVTGDNPATAKEIARQIGLWKDGEGAGALISGPDFQALPEEEAKAAVLKLKVMARARPLDKLRLVRLLKSQGQVVAVTGDGTNDAPALNFADVGLAMGRTGTAVAKEASDIILLDDSFKSIVNAIMWGRSLYQNIQRFLVFQLTINVSALAIAFLGPYLGVAMPLTVMQMLWVNLIMDTFAALALATEPPDPRVLNRPPRNPADFIITPSLARWILGMGGVFIVVLIGLLLWLKQDGPLDFDAAFAAGDAAVMRNLSFFFAFYVMLNFWNLFNVRRIASNRSIFDRPFENPFFWLIAAAILLGQFAITQGLLGAQTFSTYPLGWKDWGVIVGATSLVLWAGEAIRAWSRWMRGETKA